MSLIGRNWITRFLNRHPELVLKFVSRIDRQRTYALCRQPLHHSNPLLQAQEGYPR